MLNVLTSKAGWSLGLFNNIGPWEILIILAALLLLFGGKKLPELARGLGRGMRLFKEELSGVSKQIEEDQTEKDSSAAAKKPAEKDQPPPPS